MAFSGNYRKRKRQKSGNSGRVGRGRLLKSFLRAKSSAEEFKKRFVAEKTKNGGDFPILLGKIEFCGIQIPRKLRRTDFAESSFLEFPEKPILEEFFGGVFREKSISKLFFFRFFSVFVSAKA